MNEHQASTIIMQLASHDYNNGNGGPCNVTQARTAINDWRSNPELDLVVEQGSKAIELLGIDRAAHVYSNECNALDDGEYEDQ